jgi:hypothetical protein
VLRVKITGEWHTIATAIRRSSHLILTYRHFVKSRNRVKKRPRQPVMEQMTITLRTASALGKVECGPIIKSEEPILDKVIPVAQDS